MRYRTEKGNRGDLRKPSSKMRYVVNSKKSNVFPGSLGKIGVLETLTLGIVKTTEIDFGSTPVMEATFTITDADIVSTSYIIGDIAYVAPTGKDLDELEFDSFDFRFVAGTGQCTLYAKALEGLVADKFKINYVINKTI
jgi:hypothetical protein